MYWPLKDLKKLFNIYSGLDRSRYYHRNGARIEEVLTTKRTCLPSYGDRQAKVTKK